jgi:hypothetical protein
VTADRIRRRVLRVLGALVLVQAVLAGTGRLLSWRLDEGDESTTGIRRVRVAGGFELRPRNPELTRVRTDLVCAGGDVDLGGLAPVPGGVDLTVRAVCGGLAVRVPSGWRVWWRGRGVGGVGGADGVQRTDDERGADLRVHATVVFGGVGIERA